MSIVKTDSEDIAEIKLTLTGIILNAGWVASKKGMSKTDIVCTMKTIKKRVLRIEELLPKVNLKGIDWLKRRKEKRFSYEQAWEELKYWVQEWDRWPEQKLYRTAENDVKDIQTKMKQLEEKTLKGK